MALTNIELYEALKKDLSEDSARMIAEVVPPAGDVATRLDVAAVKADIAETRADIATVRTEVARVEAKIAEAEKRLDRRIAAAEVRLTLLFALPLWGSAIAVGAKYLFG